MNVISCSSGQSLYFPEEKLYGQYEHDSMMLKLKYYGMIREKYGIWASNQDKFVDSVEDFNDLDLKCMEELYQSHKDELKDAPVAQ